MLSLTSRKPAAVKSQKSVVLVSFTADVLSGAKNNTNHSLFSSLSLKIH